MQRCNPDNCFSLNSSGKIDGTAVIFPGVRSHVGSKSKPSKAVDIYDVSAILDMPNVGKFRVGNPDCPHDSQNQAGNEDPTNGTIFAC